MADVESDLIAAYLPWSIGPYDGTRKFYATIILDCRGVEVMRVSGIYGDRTPSPREIYQSPEDRHWESASSLATAEWIVSHMNRA